MFADCFSRVNQRLLLEEFEFLLAAGINPELYINNDSLEEEKLEKNEKITRILNKFSANTIHAPFLDIAPGGIDKDIRRVSLQKMEKVVTLAKKWHSKLIVMHFNYQPLYYEQYFESWLENAAEFYSELTDDNDAPLIALENIAETTPHVAINLLEKINSSKVIHCFDFGHHNVFGTLPFDEWLYYLKPEGHIHFHLHDNHGLIDQHLPLGAGNIDWPKAKRVISQLAVNFTITLEPHSKEDLIESADYYRSCFLNEE